MSTAVQLEVVFGLEKDLFLNTFHRTFSRSGLPTADISDKSRNFEVETMNLRNS